MMFKDVIEAKTYSLGGVDFTVVVVDRGVCETMLAAARDMLALGEARKLATAGPWKKGGNYIYNVKGEAELGTFKVIDNAYWDVNTDFIVTAANLAQKWGG